VTTIDSSHVFSPAASGSWARPSSGQVVGDPVGGDEDELDVLGQEGAEGFGPGEVPAYEEAGFAEGGGEDEVGVEAGVEVVFFAAVTGCGV